MSSAGGGRHPAWIYHLCMVFCSMLIMGAFMFGLIRWSEQKWCDLMNTLTEGYTAPASNPPSERAQKIAHDLIKLKSDFHCG